jgi:hypothetical protein
LIFTILYITKCILYCKYQPQLCPRSLTVVNILGSQKCAIPLDIPHSSIIGLINTP